MDKGTGTIKNDLLRLLIADAVIILICLGAGALLGLCFYGGTAVGILYMIRMMCFMAGGILLLAAAFMILNKKEYGAAPEKRKGKVLFQTIPLFVFCLQAGALAIVIGLIADAMVRKLIL